MRIENTYQTQINNIKDIYSVFTLYSNPCAIILVIKNRKKKKTNKIIRSILRISNENSRCNEIIESTIYFTI